MTREELRNQFKQETGKFPVVGARQPYSEHIEWLEDKLINLYKKDNLTISDVRNNLGPIKNLIALIESDPYGRSVTLRDIISEEIKRCKESIAYLSKRP